MIVGVNAFVHESLPGRVVFGFGTQAESPTKWPGSAPSGCCCSRRRRRRPRPTRVHAALGDVALRWTEVAEHVPVELAERARSAASDAHVDVIVAIGGGSAIGLAKAIALELGAPIVAVPTTYAGSEMTPMYGLTGDHKVTGRDDACAAADRGVRPRAHASACRSRRAWRAPCNALAHCIEGGYGPGANPVTTLSAVEGIRVLSANVPLLAHDAGTRAIPRCAADCCTARTSPAR